MLTHGKAKLEFSKLNPFLQKGPHNGLLYSERMLNEYPNILFDLRVPPIRALQYTVELFFIAGLVLAADARDETLEKITIKPF